MNRTFGRLATILTATVVTATLMAMPAQAATAKPKPRADKVTIVAGKTAKVAVIKNDSVAKKAKAKVKVIGKVPKGITAKVSKQTVKVQVGPYVRAGQYSIVYRVTDFKKRKANAKVVITVKPQVGSLKYWIDTLPVKAEKRDGYDRDTWKHWVKGYGNNCDTRRMVLIAEAYRAPQVDKNCSFTGGVWISKYDNAAFDDPSKLDIDHMVPLAEAHDSGGWAWTPERKQAYANDLGYEHHLLAVTASHNRAKGDKEPTHWMPPTEPCWYIAAWVSVKYRWSLSIDPAEKAFLTSQAPICGLTKYTMPRKA